MKILSVDSSAVTASVALTEDEKLIGEFFLNTGLTHSRTLMPMIEALLSCSDIRLSDIDAFAVTNGPGSFTGVRIGVSSVKGMAEAFSKPCIGVSTLLSMAYNLINIDCIICSVMDARCSQVYTALFESENGKITRITDDDAMSIDDLSKVLKAYDKDIFFVGDGAVLCWNKLSLILSNVFLPSENLIYQRAYGTAMAVYKGEMTDSFSSSQELSVSYLRLSQAERERNAKLEVNKNDSTRQ